MNFSTKFISATKEYCTFEHHVAAPYIRKSFQIEALPVKAEISITGLGFYDLYVNGNRITKGILAPYISASDDIIYYDTYDLKELLHEGENVIGVILGNGMHNCFGGYIWDLDQALWRSAPKLAMKLVCEFTDAEELVIEANESFKTAPSPIIFDDLRSGEYYDARMEQEGWCEPGFDDSTWTNVILAERPRGQAKECNVEPIVTTHELKAISIIKNDKGYIYDFGVNAAGLCRLKIDGAEGQEIEMQFCEKMQEDQLDFSGTGYFLPEGFVHKDKYICSGKGERTYVPTFTYHGFRYVQVTGITDEQATEDLIIYQVMNSGLAEIGNFSCSDEIANTLQEVARRSDLANFYYFPTDCPHREKNGWTGDAALSAEHMLLNLQVDRSYEQWLDNVRKAQREDGAFPGIVPTAGWGYRWGNGPAWDCVIVELPYMMYRYRGNKKVLEDNATAIFRYLNYITTQLDKKGLLEYGLADWCAPRRSADKPKSPLVLSDSIYSMETCRKAAEIFRILGKTLQADFAEALYHKIRNSIRKYLIDFNTMTAVGNCQGSQAFSIYYGVFDPAEKPKAFERLLEMIHAQDNHMDVGALAARILFHTLSDFGYSDLAYEMITKPTYPSYGNWLKRGATSLWETFQHEHQDSGSLNHHFYGDISNWFISKICGINLNPNVDDINELLIAPKFISSLEHAQAYHIAPAGRIDVSWKREDGEITLNISIPEGMEGMIQLENGYIFTPVNMYEGDTLRVAKSGTYKIVAL